MKYLLIILLSLFLFQASYTQEIDVEVEEQGDGGAEVEVEIEDEAGGWQDVDIDIFQSDEFSMQALNFGSQYVVAVLVGDGAMNQGNWNLSQIQLIQGQRVNGVNYRIYGKWSTDAGDSFSANFEINARGIGPSFEVKYVSYEIEGEPSIEYNEEGEVILAVGGELSVGLFEPLPLSPPNQGEEESGESFPGSWQLIDPQEVTSDSGLQSSFNDGVDSAIKNGLSSGALPEGDWSLLSLDYVQLQVLEDSKYLFWVTLTDGDITRAQASIWYVRGDLVEFVLSDGIWQVGPAIA